MFKRMCRFAALTFLLASPPLLARDSFKAAAEAERLDPALLYSVALAESARIVDGLKVVPWPWTINSPKTGPRYFKTREEAEAQLRNLIAEGVKNIDVGMMQINLKYHGDKVEDPLLLLDPEHNLSLGAKILRQAMRTTKDPVLGVGRYHSSEPTRAYSYGYRVWKIYYRVRGYLNAAERMRL